MEKGSQCRWAHHLWPLDNKMMPCDFLIKDHEVSLCVLSHSLVFDSATPWTVAHCRRKRYGWLILDGIRRWKEVMHLISKRIYWEHPMDQGLCRLTRIKWQIKINLAPELLENSGDIKKNTVIHLMITQVCVLIQAVISSKNEKSILNIL